MLKNKSRGEFLELLNIKKFFRNEGKRTAIPSEIAQ